MPTAKRLSSTGLYPAGRQRPAGRRRRAPARRIQPSSFYRLPRSDYHRVMSTTKHPISIGTSGWSYPEWDGAFYPPGMDPSDYLSWYADRFPIVEVDSTFYRVPTRRMVQGWHNHTPPGFRFALKVPQAITHKKQLQGCEKDDRGVRRGDRPPGREADLRLAPDGVFQSRAVPVAGGVPGGPRPVPGVVAARCSAAGAGDPQPEVGRSTSWPMCSGGTTRP